ncbi:matrin-3-like isoform X2 [Pristis pectinata]|uniref:matrin-3-like isoform X2 n=1 Tax=Pristis pectinata TaxID=685728 RepID=UPI00223D5947|nr:matrin-3-like isoform X2 [Pristis pectinata]
MASFGRGQSNQMRTKRKSRFHDADAGGHAAGPPLNIQAALGTLCQNPHLAGLINSGQGQSYGLHGTGQGQNYGPQGVGPGQNFGSQGVGQGQNFGPQGVGQRAKGLMSSAGGPSRYSDTASNSLPSLFGVRNQNQQSHAVQKQIDADRASNILAAFGLSSRDLDELSHYPEDKLTPESLPEILMEIKRRRANEGTSSKYNRGDGSLRHDRSYRASHDDWEEERHFRKHNYGSRDSSLDSVVEYSHGHSSRESSSRYDRKDYERERLRGNDDFSREEMHLSESSHNFNKFDSDYGRAARLPSPRTHERSLFERKRGSPSLNNINDYHGFLPAVFPYLCSLCDLTIHSVQDWNQHNNSSTHRRLCDLLVEIYPEWNPDAFQPQMGDPLVLQSTNLAPGILGPPPSGSFLTSNRGLGGMESHGASNRKGPMDNKQGNNVQRIKKPLRMNVNDEPGRVVHISELQRGRCMNRDLIKLAEPFGKVTNYLLIKSKGEGFVELAYPEAAQAMVKFYQMKPTFVDGNVIRAELSQKYKKLTIKKGGGVAENRENVCDRMQSKVVKGKESEERSRVVHISNLPSVGYSDSEIVRLGTPFGKVTNYLLMRVKNQVFLEMETHHIAMTMIEKFKKVPLMFHGRELKVYLSQKYKNLVLRKQGRGVDELLGNRERENRKRGRSHSPPSKRARSPSNKRKAQEKLKNSKGTDHDNTQMGSPLVEEGTDQKQVEGANVAKIKSPGGPSAGTENCEEPDGSADLLLTYHESMNIESELSGREGDMEVELEGEMEVGHFNEGEANDAEPSSQTAAQLSEKRSEGIHCPEYTEEFFALDEVDDSNAVLSKKVRSVQGDKVDANFVKDEQDVKSQSYDARYSMVENTEVDAQGDDELKMSSPTSAEPSTEQIQALSPLPDEYKLGPYKPNNPVGLDYVVPKTGFYCKLCCLFYTSEETAKQTHCGTIEHYQRLKKVLDKQAVEYWKEKQQQIIPE